MIAQLQPFMTEVVDAARSPVFAISIALTILILIVYHWIVVRRLVRTISDSRHEPIAKSDSADVVDLRERVAAIEAAAARNLQCVGFVRFNAFGDVGSELSYALAVLDINGNGFVLSSIYSREEVRTYAKAVRSFAADKDVSNEELRALEQARQQAQRRP